MAILLAKKATKRFGGLVAVQELDIEVEEKSIHSIIGPNGAGKTTFFNCVTGFYKAEEERSCSTTIPWWSAPRPDRPPGNHSHLPEYPPLSPT